MRRGTPRPSVKPHPPGVRRGCGLVEAASVGKFHRLGEGADPEGTVLGPARDGRHRDPREPMCIGVDGLVERPARGALERPRPPQGEAGRPRRCGHAGGPPIPEPGVDGIRPRDAERGGVGRGAVGSKGLAVAEKIASSAASPGSPFCEAHRARSGPVAGKTSYLSGNHDDASSHSTTRSWGKNGRHDPRKRRYWKSGARVLIGELHDDGPPPPHSVLPDDVHPSLRRQHRHRNDHVRGPQGVRVEGRPPNHASGDRPPGRNRPATPAADRVGAS